MIAPAAGVADNLTDSSRCRRIVPFMSKRATFAVSLAAAATAIPVAIAAPGPGLTLVTKQPLVVQGARFHVGERVTVTAMTSLGPRVVRVTVGNAGRFRVVFQLPKQPCAAPFAIRARGTTGTLATMSVTLGAPCTPPPVD